MAVTATASSSVGSTPQKQHQPSQFHHNNGNGNSNGNGNINSNIQNRKPKKKKKSTIRVATEILVALLVVEYYFLQKFSANELEQHEHTERKELESQKNGFLENKSSKRRSIRDKDGRLLDKEALLRRHDEDRLKRLMNRTKTHMDRKRLKREEQDFQLLQDDDAIVNMNATMTQDLLKTAHKLRHMGVNGEIKLKDLPPWSQIIDNFNAVSQDDEPVILGLEYCEDFRKTHSPSVIGEGSAGLFSTGTNLIYTLMHRNCRPPVVRLNGFILPQTPYGKHNPADARFYHQVTFPVVAKREAILPVVAIRHPYTWMMAMCLHTYKTKWSHDRRLCHNQKSLRNPVMKVPYGFKQYNDTHNVINYYDSLAAMWMEWYKPYFLDSRYNQTPRLMVRHEDMVFRPEKVISKVCECIGGTNMNPNPDWEAPDGFEYEEETANRGKGHGKGRSGLFTAVLKYGGPLRQWYDGYNLNDRRVMSQTFQNQKDPELRKIFEAFQYRLYDDVRAPTKEELRGNYKRAEARIKDEQERLRKMRREARAKNESARAAADFL